MKQKHLALLIPHTDTTLEADLTAGLPEGWVYHSHRMHLDEVGEEAEKRMVDECLPLGLRQLKGIIPFDAAIFGCTSASAVYGKEGLEWIHRQLKEELNCPSISAFGAVKGQIEAAGCPPLALLTPYSREVNAFFVNSLAVFGITTVFCTGLGLVQDPEIAACPPEKIRQFVLGNKEAIRASGAGMVLVSCTNLQACALRQELEQELGLPVITSNQCLLDWIKAL